MQSLLNKFKTHISELKSEGFFDELHEDMIDPELHTDRFNTQRQNNSRHSRTGSMLEQHRQQMADSIQDALEKLYDGFYYWSHKEINKGQWWGTLGLIIIQQANTTACSSKWVVRTAGRGLSHSIYCINHMT